MKKLLSLVLGLFMVLTAVLPALAENTEAPRAYFPYPAELEGLPENPSLPDLFEFFDASADPDGSGRVETPEEWDARAAEIRDMAQYYLYGSRMDPLKSDTVVTAVRENFDYQWADGIMQSDRSRWGYTALPLLPEGAYTCSVLDFSAWGMGLFYNGIAPDDSFVYHGEGFDMPEGLNAWKEGDTWQEHADAVTKITLPTVTVDMLIRDTNPDNADYVSEAAKEGVPFSFNIRYPAEAPTVDGVVRDAHASRHGTGYPVMVAISGLTEEQIVTLNNNGYAYISVNDTAESENVPVRVYINNYSPLGLFFRNSNTTAKPCRCATRARTSTRCWT